MVRDTWGGGGSAWLMRSRGISDHFVAAGTIVGSFFFFPRRAGWGRDFGDLDGYCLGVSVLIQSPLLKNVCDLFFCAPLCMHASCGRFALWSQF